VKVVEETIGLVTAVGACKGVIVASNGWTKTAEVKSAATGVDLRLLTLEEALDLIVPDKWQMCQACFSDCIVLDHDGALEVDDSIFWWLAGQCRNCRSGFAWCQECGEYLHIPVGEAVRCPCGHSWSCAEDGMYLVPRGSGARLKI